MAPGESLSRAERAGAGGDGVAAREQYGVDVEYTGDPDALVRPPESYRVRSATPRRSGG